jgi:hypothetical protein
MSGTVSPRQMRHYESRLAMVSHGKLMIMTGDFPEDDEPVIEVEVKGWPLTADMATKIIEGIKPVLAAVAKSEGCKLSTKLK